MNSHEQIGMQSRKDPAQLEREIDQQRVHIETLVQALERKLTPGELFEQALGRAGGGREFAGNLGDTVKANPLPTLLTVAGLAWLYAGKDKPADDAASMHDVDDMHADEQPHLGERARHLGHEVSDKLGSAKAHATESAHGASDAMRRQAQRVNSGYHHMLEDNPMALGALGIAAGALLGALLPETRKENEWLGRSSDRLKDDTRDMARSGYDQVVAAGREATEPPAASASTSTGDGRYHPDPTPDTTPASRAH